MGSAVSSVASIAGIGLQAEGSMMKAEGEKAGDDFAAGRAERAAEFGKVQADLTDATMRENLNTTLGHIESVRAAGNIDPTSPTTQAILDRDQLVSDRLRTAKLASINAQVTEDQLSADYLKKAGNYALKLGKVDAMAKVFSGVAKVGDDLTRTAMQAMTAGAG